jgi:transposase
MTTNEEVHESIRPLLKLSRDMISRSQKLDHALVSSLQRDPVLKERLRRLRTVPGVGPFTALTWALEIGDYTRFSSIKQAISYCGLCGDEKSSAEKVMRMPISKQRNKHIQRVLIGATVPQLDRNDLAKLSRALRPKGKIISVEFPGSPRLAIADRYLKSGDENAILQAIRALVSGDSESDLEARRR